MTVEKKAKQTNNTIGIGWSGDFLKIVKRMRYKDSESVEVVGLYNTKGVSEQEIAETIKSALHKTTSVGNVICLVPRKNVIIRLLELPSINDKEIRNMVSLQLERHFPYAPEEMHYDIVSFQSVKKGYSQVMLAAINKEECDRILRIFSLSGVHVDRLSISSWGIVTAYNHSKLCHSLGNECALIIHSDYNETEFIMMHQGRMMYTRSFSHSADFSLTENRKGFLDHLMSEMNNTLDIVKQNTQFERLQHVVLSPTLRPVENDLAALLLNEVTIYYLDECAVRGEEKDRTTIEENNLSVVPFYEIHTIGDGPCVDLLPSLLKKRSLFRGTKSARMFFLALLSIFIGVCIIGISILFFQKSNYIQSVEKQLLKMDPEAKKISHVIRKIRIIDQIKKGQVLPLELIAELYRVVPEKMYLTLFEYDSAGGVTVRGYTSNLTQVSDFLLVLQKSPYFSNAEIKFAKQKQVKGNTAVDFEIHNPYFLVNE